MSLNKTTIAEYFKTLQDSICHELEKADGNVKYLEDNWEHQSGGGGRTRVFRNGAVIEKGGVNFSQVQGPTSEQLMKHFKLEKPLEFFATGVSIVIHPANPHVPIIHMNVRYFELSNGVHWFGGGIDLTPHYIDEPQAKWFHEQIKAACDKHDISYYPKYKDWADDYFFIPHRNETRGVGGIFFDYIKAETEEQKKENFEFVKSVGESFAPIYTHLMQLNKGKAFTTEEKKWQKIRRGRYAEFNLVWDRGTKFGLETGGRTESILMSLPPETNWEYNYKVKEGSEEEKTLNLLKKGIDWTQN